MGFWDRFSNKEETKVVNPTTDEVARIKKGLQQASYSYSTQLEAFIDSIEDKDLYCDKITFWKNISDIVSKDIELSLGTKLCRNLYNVIVTDKDNKNDMYRFEKFKKLLLKKELINQNNEIHTFINNIGKYYILFNDKEAAFMLLQQIITPKEDETTKDRIAIANEIVDFMIETRKYFNDEAAFIALISGTIKSIDELSFGASNRISVFEEQKRKARQLAGFYDIDEVAIAQTNKYVEQLQDKYNSLVANIAKTNNILNEAQEKAVEDFKKETQGILANADRIIAEVNEASDSRKKQIEDLGTGILREIHRLIDEHPEAEEVLRTKDSGYNPLLDMRKPARERYNAAIKNLKTTEYYHDCFKDALGYVIINQPVFLQGPTGCGKSHMAKQIAEVLEVPFYNIGFITDAWNEIKGWNNAAGNFEKTSFYDAYKYGGVAFIDEIDISNPQALMELNKITGENGYEPYIFQNGECVTPHPNFRLVAAGNTFGRGGDQDYQRNALDISTLDRYQKVQVTYNEELEREILKNHYDIYEYLITLRAVAGERNSSLLVTTKSLTDIRNAIESGIFDLAQAFNGKLINGESVDILEELNKEVINRKGNSEPAKAFTKAIQLRKGN